MCLMCQCLSCTHSETTSVLFHCVSLSVFWECVYMFYVVFKYTILKYYYEKMSYVVYRNIYYNLISCLLNVGPWLGMHILCGVWGGALSSPLAFVTSSHAVFLTCDDPASWDPVALLTCSAHPEVRNYTIFTSVTRFSPATNLMIRCSPSRHLEIPLLAFTWDGNKREARKDDGEENRRHKNGGMIGTKRFSVSSVIET